MHRALFVCTWAELYAPTCICMVRLSAMARMCCATPLFPCASSYNSTSSALGISVFTPKAGGDADAGVPFTRHWCDRAPMVFVCLMHTAFVLAGVRLVLTDRTIKLVAASRWCCWPGCRPPAYACVSCAHHFQPLAARHVLFFPSRKVPCNSNGVLGPTPPACAITCFTSSLSQLGAELGYGRLQPFAGSLTLCAACGSRSHSGSETGWPPHTPPPRPPQGASGQGRSSLQQPKEARRREWRRSRRCSGWIAVLAEQGIGGP